VRLVIATIYVIASEAKQSMEQQSWIASSLALLAMTG
jgi:flagellar basal body rod protein FlgF